MPGICGIVNGSILPGYYGIEAGQSAVGDILKWWVEGVCEGDDALHAALSARGRTAAARGSPASLALDWNNGNRTILVDPRLTGLLRRPDAPHDAGRDLPGAHRGHRLRRPRHHRADDRVRRPGRAGRLLRRHRREERPVHADLRRRARAPHAHRRLAADPGPRLGDLGGGGGRSGRGRPRHLRGGPGAHELPEGQAVRPGPEGQGGLRRALRALPRAARRLRRGRAGRRPTSAPS